MGMGSPPPRRVPREIGRAVDATDCAQTRTLFAAYHRRLHAWLFNDTDGRVLPAKEPDRKPPPPPPPPPPPIIAGPIPLPRRVVRVLLIERTRSRGIHDLPGLADTLRSHSYPLLPSYTYTYPLSPTHSYLPTRTHCLLPTPTFLHVHRFGRHASQPRRHDGGQRVRLGRRL